jgi:hypothetical protein
LRRRRFHCRCCQTITIERRLVHLISVLATLFALRCSFN